MSTSTDRDSHEEKRTSSSDEKRAFLLPIVEHDEPSSAEAAPASSLAPKLKPLSRKFWISAAINTLSTAAIVFTNKRIFSHAPLRHAQVSFAAFHFAITGLFLYTISRPRIGIFTAKHVPVLAVLPLALAMIPNVVLPNASLAYSSVQFYQVARVLLTPCVVLINYALYSSRISRSAALTLIPVCVGVAVVSYFDTAPKGEVDEKKTSVIGVCFAFGGVLASAVYTVMIKSYHAKLECTSHQLLLNQAMVSVVPMLYLIPFVDDVTVHTSTGWRSWGLILMSAVFACLINLTQFIIIQEGGSVTSTVVGHFKTCVVITIGWVVSGKSVTDASMGGIVMTVGGIITYQAVQQREARK